jgi:hypothetical protein
VQRTTTNINAWNPEFLKQPNVKIVRK